MARKKKEDAPVVRGYKVFDKDWRCMGFQYEVGKEFRLKKGQKLEMCVCGFHFCKKTADCFNYQKFSTENKCAEVEAVGEVMEDGDKCVTDAIRIVREIGWHEMLELCNTGHGNTGLRNSGNWNSGNRNSGNWNSGNRNSGNRNSGDRNSGNRNSGDFNSGYFNSGDCNSGDFNSGDFNSGYFNTDEPPVRIFNKNTRKSRHEIEFPKFFYWVTPCEWVDFSDMTDEEKKEKISYKDAWRKAFNKAKGMDNWQEEKEKLLALTNFNFRIFEEITGISKKDIMGAPCGAEDKDK